MKLSDLTLYLCIETGVFKKFGVDNFSLKKQVSRRQFKEKYNIRKDFSLENRLYNVSRTLTFQLIKIKKGEF
jgi:hypothetical protein